MLNLKQGMTAVALAATLGLVVPSTFGGSAFADVSDQNPNRVETTLHCEIGDDIVSYDVVSTWAADGWQVKNSSTVLNVIYSEYEAFYVAIDPPDLNDNFSESGAGGPGYPNAKKKGQLAKAVTCLSDNTETWTSDGSVGIEGHTYFGDIDNTWYVTISGNKSGLVQATNADDSQSVDRQQSSKNKDAKGKHRGKGKRGR